MESIVYLIRNIKTKTPYLRKGAYGGNTPEALLHQARFYKTREMALKQIYPSDKGKVEVVKVKIEVIND